MSAFQFEQIGVIHSPYKEKFAVPRQPGLVTSGSGELHLIAPYNQADAVRGLEAFSHLWVVFVFHQTMEGGWRPTVRPPRLGGNARMGVFATRSTFRPNPVGMSLVELKGIRCQKDRVILELGSLDLVDGTPVIDIKPYLPFAEALPDARASYAQDAPQADMPVYFTPEITAQIGSWRNAILAYGISSLKFWHRTRVRPTVKKRKKEKRTPSGCSISTFAGASPGQVLKCLPLNPGNFVLLSFGIFATLVN